MRKLMYSEGQAVSFLKEAKVDRKVSERCREHGVSTATFNQWRCKNGGMEASTLKRLEELLSENKKLKRMCAEIAFSKRAIKELLEQRKGRP